MTLGSRFAQERKRLGETQQDWADYLGITRSAVAMIEADRASVDTGKLMALWERGVDALYLLTGRRSDIAAGDLIDWALLVKIADRLAHWEAEKGIRIPEAKRPTVLKVLYQRLAESARAGNAAIDEMLDLAA